MPDFRMPFLVLFLSASIGSADVVIELGTQPQAPNHASELRARSEATRPVAKVVPSSSSWYLPFEIDDSVPGGANTLFAVRNEREDGLSVSLRIDYVGPDNVDIVTETPTVADHAVFTRNVRDVPALVASGARRVGYVRIIPLTVLGPVSVDYFRVDGGQNYASGGAAFTADGFCAQWQARFLRFPGDSATTLTFLINGPLGSDPTDDPTVVADVYNEAGGFLNSFTVRTDDYVFEITAADVVGAGNDFGTMEIVLDSIYSPPGLVAVAYRAFGRFSVGSMAVCRD